MTVDAKIGRHRKSIFRAVMTFQQNLVENCIRKSCIEIRALCLIRVIRAHIMHNTHYTRSGRYATFRSILPKKAETQQRTRAHKFPQLGD